MAEQSEDGQEKTEDPTPKRRQETKRKGQIPRSRELTTTLILLAAAAALLVLGGYMGSRLTSLLEWAFTLDRGHIFEPGAVVRHLHEAVGRGLLTVLPFILVMLVMALLAPVALGGWTFSFHPMAPKPEKLSPIKGFQRMFGTRAAVELAKSVGKVLVVGSTAILLFYLFYGDFQAMTRAPLETAMAEGIRLFYIFFFLLALSLLVVVAIDVPYQIYDHTQKIRMTRQEVKDEYKQTEGKPEVKQKIRQQQQELSNRRMMEKVPEADVVVTNPTQFAVALSYDQRTMKAPIVVAKGTDMVAARIRYIAEENDVPVFRAPPLARALYYTTELEQQIPGRLYFATAQVLAYVYQLRAANRYGRREPERPEPDVPEDLHFYDGGDDPGTTGGRNTDE